MAPCLASIWSRMADCVVALMLGLAATRPVAGAGAGASADGKSSRSSTASNSVPSRDPRRSHWSFQPVRQTVPPALATQRRGEVPGHVIDTFIAERLRQKGLPVPKAATRRALIRRVTYDLTGLPPTPEAVEAFVTIADMQSFTRAAEALGTTQGAISVKLKRLEDRLG